MVRVVAAQVVHVDRDLGVIDKPLEKLVHQVDIELADHRALESDLPDQSGAARKIDHHAAQRLVQRHVGMTKAADAALVADRLGHGLAQRDADVFDRVVAIDVQIALCLDRQIERAVARHLLEHMVEKADPGADAPATRPIQVDLDPDPGLLCFAHDLRAARRRLAVPLIHDSAPSACRNASFSCGVPTVTRRQPANSGCDPETFFTRIPRPHSPANSRSGSPTRNRMKLAAESNGATPVSARSALSRLARSASCGIHVSCANGRYASSITTSPGAWSRIASSSARAKQLPVGLFG